MSVSFVPEPFPRACALITPFEAVCQLAALEGPAEAASKPESGPIAHPEGTREWWNEWWDRWAQTEAPSDAAEKIERRIYDALAAGELGAYVHRDGGDVLYRIERSYWRDDDWWTLRLSDRLFSWDQGFDHAYADLPLFVRQDELAGFLNQERKPRAEPERTGNAEVQIDEIRPPTQTRPKPKWYPMLRDEFTKAHQRLEDWPKQHPDKLPPQFPTAAHFRRRLISRGIGEADIAASVVRYHVLALKREFDLAA